MQALQHGLEQAVDGVGAGQLQQAAQHLGRAQRVVGGGQGAGVQEVQQRAHRRRRVRQVQRAAARRGRGRRRRRRLEGRRRRLCAGGGGGGGGGGGRGGRLAVPRRGRGCGRGRGAGGRGGGDYRVDRRRDGDARVAARHAGRGAGRGRAERRVVRAAAVAGRQRRAVRAAAAARCGRGVGGRRGAVAQQLHEVRPPAAGEEVRVGGDALAAEGEEVHVGELAALQQAGAEVLGGARVGAAGARPGGGLGPQRGRQARGGGGDEGGVAGGGPRGGAAARVGVEAEGLELDDAHVGEVETAVVVVVDERAAPVAQHHEGVAPRPQHAAVPAALREHAAARVQPPPAQRPQVQRPQRVLLPRRRQVRAADHEVARQHPAVGEAQPRGTGRAAARHGLLDDRPVRPPHVQLELEVEEVVVGVDEHGRGRRAVAAALLPVPRLARAIAAVALPQLRRGQPLERRDDAAVRAAAAAQARGRGPAQAAQVEDGDLLDVVVGAVLPPDDDHLGAAGAVERDADAALVGRAAGARRVVVHGAEGRVGRGEDGRRGQHRGAVRVAALRVVARRDVRPGARVHVVHVDVGHDDHLGRLRLARARARRLLLRFARALRRGRAARCGRGAHAAVADELAIAQRTDAVKVARRRHLAARLEAGPVAAHQVQRVQVGRQLRAAARQALAAEDVQAVAEHGRGGADEGARRPPRAAVHAAHEVRHVRRGGAGGRRIGGGRGGGGRAVVGARSLGVRGRVAAGLAEARGAAVGVILERGRRRRARAVEPVRVGRCGRGGRAGRAGPAGADRGSRHGARRELRRGGRRGGRDGLARGAAAARGGRRGEGAVRVCEVGDDDRHVPRAQRGARGRLRSGRRRCFELRLRFRLGPPLRWRRRRGVEPVRLLLLLLLLLPPRLCAPLPLAQAVRELVGGRVEVLELGGGR